MLNRGESESCGFPKHWAPETSEFLAGLMSESRQFPLNMLDETMKMNQKGWEVEIFHTIQLFTAFKTLTRVFSFGLKRRPLQILHVYFRYTFRPSAALAPP